MDQTVNLCFRYQQPDYLRATEANFGSPVRLWLDFAVVIVVAIAGLYCWELAGAKWIGILFVSLSAVFAVVLLMGLVIVPRLVFRGTPKFQGEYTLVFSPEGVHFRTAGIDSHLRWDLYSRALIDSYSYLLYHGPRSFTVVPKRVFENADQRSAFERLLSQHIPKIVRRGSR